MIRTMNPLTRISGKGTSARNSESEKHAVHIVSQHIDDCPDYENEVDNQGYDQGTSRIGIATAKLLNAIGRHVLHGHLLVTWLP